MHMHSFACSSRASSRAIRSTAVKQLARSMATVRSSVPHEQRTATEPRANSLEPVLLSHIREINPFIRLLRLQSIDPNHHIQFLPGQWLDTFIPGLKQAGGFTITSTPRDAKPSKSYPSYLELAVQKSKNPPAEWLWRPEEEIVGTKLVVRVGGSFTWPPPAIDVQKVDRVVLVAGGVGINPLISIFAHLVRSYNRPREIHFLYGTRAVDSELDRQQILFLPRLMDLCAAAADAGVSLRLFLSNTGDEGPIDHGQLPNYTYGRRMTEADLTRALDGYKPSVFGPDHDRRDTLCYVCGPQKMTDELVTFLAKQPGMAKERVLCEKWW